MEHPDGRQFSPDQQHSQESASLLTAIEGAHSQFEICVAALESILAEDEPGDMAHFGLIRFRLCRANLARTDVARKVCEHLLSVLPAKEAPALRALHQCEIEHFQMISGHVQHWTSDALQNDWPGYRRATHKLLNRTRELIASEKELVFPLLSAMVRPLK